MSNFSEFKQQLQEQLVRKVHKSLSVKSLSMKNSPRATTSCKLQVHHVIHRRCNQVESKAS